MALGVLVLGVKKLRVWIKVQCDFKFVCKMIMAQAHICPSIIWHISASAQLSIFNIIPSLTRDKIKPKMCLSKKTLHDKNQFKSIRLFVRNDSLKVSKIKHYQVSSRIIKRHQASSVIKRHQASSSVIKCHQVSSSVIKHHQASSSSVTKKH